MIYCDVLEEIYLHLRPTLLPPTISYSLLPSPPITGCDPDLCFFLSCRPSPLRVLTVRRNFTMYSSCSLKQSVEAFYNNLSVIQSYVTTYGC